MDAIKFMTEYQRMCTSYGRCEDCPLKADKPCCEMPYRYTKELSSNLIKVVDDWSDNHPVVTRADLFKKIYPNAATGPSGVLLICPSELDLNFRCEEQQTGCLECRQKYWLKEVQE